MIETGQIAPDFEVKNTKEKWVSLNDFKGKTLVLYFYPRDLSPSCTVEAQEFRDLIKEFEQLNSTIVGVSKDSCDSHKKFTERHKLNFDLLSDMEGTMLKNYDVWKKKTLYGKTLLGIERTTFLINRHGKIEFVWKKVVSKGHAKQVLNKIVELGL